ncbi:MAG TPA: NAD-dependent epimerase/dehydratase family protein [Candidatus Dormibacteraeota bacterium]|nr:NAD-dependent epimerase/dehydratase family protein [Candidatus Dormibacteraeota bacterium]
MRAVVTGAAGFIGSHLCERLLADDHEVVGIDCFRDQYPRRLKEQNLRAARTAPQFSFHELDLAGDDLRPALDGADVVFHLAGRSGLGNPCGPDFTEYVGDNIVATQRLLEALAANPVKRLVYAGSSAVYGDAERFPTRESTVPRPLSSYGVSKLAGESLTHLYGWRLGLPVTILRYFTLYGPRQRPDMAISRFVRALTRGDEIEIRGDGAQTRDFTFIDDAIEATIRAAKADVGGAILNVGGGSRATINAVLEALEEITGRRSLRRYVPAPLADQRHSAASINAARRLLSWEPKVGLRAGLAEQWSWFQSQSAPLEAKSREAVAV